MRIIILFNPISGSGRAARIGEATARRLQAAGHEVTVTHTRPPQESPSAWLDPQLSTVDLLIVAGGDGALRMVSESASQTNTAIYQLPCGTENLFAREFGMDCRDDTLLRAIERYDVQQIDMGFANGEPFLLMASVGYDAEVVHELAGRRGASISHFSYLPPIWTQLQRWRPACLEVTVDGTRIDLPQGGPGFVVIGNSKQYGWRLNPAGKASMTDGQFDVAYFPTRSRRELIAWALKCRFQRHLHDKRLVYRTGRHVLVCCHGHCKFQLDGDPAGHKDAEGNANTGECPLQLEVKITPKALRVLVP